MSYCVKNLMCSFLPSFNFGAISKQYDKEEIQKNRAQKQKKKRKSMSRSKKKSKQQLTESEIENNQILQKRKSENLFNAHLQMAMEQKKKRDSIHHKYSIDYNDHNDHDDQIENEEKTNHITDIPPSITSPTTPTSVTSPTKVVKTEKMNNIIDEIKMKQQAMKSKKKHKKKRKKKKMKQKLHNETPSTIPENELKIVSDMGPPPPPPPPPNAINNGYNSSSSSYPSELSDLSGLDSSTITAIPGNMSDQSSSAYATSPEVPYSGGNNQSNDNAPVYEIVQNCGNMNMNMNDNNNINKNWNPMHYIEVKQKWYQYQHSIEQQWCYLVPKQRSEYRESAKSYEKQEEEYRNALMEQWHNMSVEEKQLNQMLYAHVLETQQWYDYQNYNQQEEVGLVMNNNDEYITPQGPPAIPFPYEAYTPDGPKEQYVANAEGGWA